MSGISLRQYPVGTYRLVRPRLCRLPALFLVIFGRVFTNSRRIKFVYLGLQIRYGGIGADILVSRTVGGLTVPRKQQVQETMERSRYSGGEASRLGRAEMTD